MLDLTKHRLYNGLLNRLFKDCMNPWSLTSWKTYRYHQAVVYSDKTHLNKVIDELKSLPPLVSQGEVEQLKQSILKAGKGEAFILQGGDCAELFSDCRADIIDNKLAILLEMSSILQRSLNKPIVQIGRIAGQYAKPRSFEQEIIDGISLPSYRGDLVNSSVFNLTARTPNPELLLQGYRYAAITLNYIRALVAGSTHFFASHEALNLDYEQALTRPYTNQWYNLSTHLPWIGLRTASIDSAHVELLRGVANPIGIKVGPKTSVDTLLQLLNTLNPKGEEGKLLLITRMGANQVSACLPNLIKRVLDSTIPVTWSCDPMHGNTEITKEGLKTRHFNNIMLELEQTLTLHAQLGSHLGGVHLELTGEHVTECLGGMRELTSSDLNQAYHTLVDPRLNYEQSLELAFKLGQLLS